MEELLAQIDFLEARDLYHRRELAHHDLRQLFAAEDFDGFAHLALGISNVAGNYSAAEHRLGPRILHEATAADVFDLATAIEECRDTHHLPKLIYDHDVPYLKISVGSEIAMMLKPEVHWVGNVRTIWSHLLLKHLGNRSRANQELALYRDGERDSEMDYAIWRDVYLAIEPSMLQLARLAAEAARDRGIEPGTLRYMWPDSVASTLFDRFADPW